MIMNLSTEELFEIFKTQLNEKLQSSGYYVGEVQKDGVGFEFKVYRLDAPLGSSKYQKMVIDITTVIEYPDFSGGDKERVLNKYIKDVDESLHK